MENLLTTVVSAPGPLQGELSRLADGLEWVTSAIDLAAIVIMLIGSVRFLAGFVKAEASGDADARVKRIDGERMELGRYILSALELLIVSDIIHTALSLALSDLLILGLLVLIRSAISFFLGREIREISEEMRG